MLGFNGRKSGRRFTVTVSAHQIDDVVYALADSVWTVNFRGGGPADVLYDGKPTAMRGELTKGPATVAELFHRCATGYGAPRAQRMMGVEFRDSAVPSVE